MTTIAEEFLAATEHTNGDVGRVLRRAAELAKKVGQSRDLEALAGEVGGLIGEDPEIDDETLATALWTAGGGQELIERFLASPMPRTLPRARLAGSIDEPRPEALLSAAGTGPGAVLAVGESCLLAGAGGAGKSSLAGEIALAVADDGQGSGSAGNLLEVHKRGAVLWLTFEEAPAELAHRLRALTVCAERDGATESGACAGLPRWLAPVWPCGAAGEGRPVQPATRAAGGVGGYAGGGGCHRGRFGPRCCRSCGSRVRRRSFFPCRRAGICRCHVCLCAGTRGGEPYAGALDEERSRERKPAGPWARGRKRSMGGRRSGLSCAGLHA